MLRKLSGFVAVAGMVVTVACGQTDAGITTNVKTKLAADDTVKAYQVDVDTQNRVVTLSGDVENLAAKERAIMIARETDGVSDVIDRIQVNAAEATSGISGDLRIDADKPDVDVDVDVDDKLENDARRGAAATKNSAEKAADATVDGAKKVGSATAEGAKKVGSATAEGAKKVGSATAEGAKEVGGAVRDAVTDDDPDSDKDGK